MFCGPVRKSLGKERERATSWERHLLVYYGVSLLYENTINWVAIVWRRILHLW